MVEWVTLPFFSFLFFFKASVLSTCISMHKLFFHTLAHQEPTPFGVSIVQPKFSPPLSDLSPFFQRHYVKGASDIFMAYGRLLAEITLVLPNQVSRNISTLFHSVCLISFFSLLCFVFVFSFGR